MNLISNIKEDKFKDFKVYLSINLDKVKFHEKE